MIRIVLLTLTLAAGCRGPSAAAVKNELTTRAAFDFNCPEAEIKTQALNGEGSLQGATGCGKRATYATDGQKWIMNTASGEPTTDSQTQTTHAGANP